jgi:hypothetical protein
MTRYGLPDKPMYYAEFSTQVGAEAMSIAMLGFVLVKNQYEERVYAAAVALMQAVIAGEQDPSWGAAQYSGQFGMRCLFLHEAGHKLAIDNEGHFELL